MNDENAIRLLGAAPARALLPSGSPSDTGGPPAPAGSEGPLRVGGGPEEVEEGGTVLAAGLGRWNGPGHE